MKRRGFLGALLAAVGAGALAERVLGPTLPSVYDTFYKYSAGDFVWFSQERVVGLKNLVDDGTCVTWIGVNWAPHPTLTRDLLPR